MLGKDLNVLAVDHQLAGGALPDGHLLLMVVGVTVRDVKLEHVHHVVERYERVIDSLNIKTLFNGSPKDQSAYPIEPINAHFGGQDFSG